MYNKLINNVIPLLLLMQTVSIFKADVVEHRYRINNCELVLCHLLLSPEKINICKYINDYNLSPLREFQMFEQNKQRGSILIDW